MGDTAVYVPAGVSFLKHFGQFKYTFILEAIVI